MNILHCHQHPFAPKWDELIDAIKHLESTKMDGDTAFSVCHIICVTIIILALIAAAIYAIKLFKNDRTSGDFKTDKDKREREKLKNDYRAKLLDFIKTETNSFEKISKEYDSLKQKGNIEIAKVLSNHKERISAFFNEEELSKIISELEKDINSLIDKTMSGCQELGNSMGGLLDEIKKKDDAVKNRLYYTQINSYISEQSEE